MKISEILIDPDTKKKLVVNWEQGTIENLNKDLFQWQFLNGVPSILPKRKSQNYKSTDLHKATNSEFDYIDHYIKDADTFDYFQNSDEITENERIRLNELIVNKISNDSNLILDVGCGNGWLSKTVPLNNTQIVSLDISQTNVERVLKEQPHPNHIGIVADVFHLPFQEETFDIVVASEIIEHVYDPKEFVNCLLRILKPKGKLIITTPYNEKIPLSLCVHCNKPTPRHAHLHSFNEVNIKKIVSNKLTKLKIDKMTNKYLLKLRVYWLMRSFPFKLWRTIDKIAIKVFGNPTRLVLEIIK